MILSPNKILGSIIYNTREALNSNKDFMSLASTYFFKDNCIVNDRFNLWHYPGTANEISNILLKLNEHPNGARLKFPSFFNFQPIRQEKNGIDTTIYYNLAITGWVESQWLTEERENEVFDKILRPVYDEFINQIKKSKYFDLDYGIPMHSYYEVFTTGDNQGVLLKKYGDYIDAVEIHNLRLKLKTELCLKDKETIERNNLLVTENFKDILNYK